MRDPKVSIVLPTFNGEKFIRQSVQSCLQQTFTDFELIIVNDCSTDNTLEILQEFSATDTRIKIITNAENKKLPLSLNVGFEAARGTYLTWTSDDNYYAPEAIATLVEVLDSNKGIDLIYTDYQLVNDQNRVFGERRFGDVNESFTKWLGCGACFLYKREVHLANKGYNPAAFLIEDFEFFMRAFTQFNFKYLPISHLYFYREHEGSLTAQYHAIVNDMAKIFLERNITALEIRLGKNDRILLYRKLAVFYGATKTTPFKYQHYLRKLKTLSLQQSLIVMVYVPLIKLVQFFQVLGLALKTMFSNRLP